MNRPRQDGLSEWNFGKRAHYSSLQKDPHLGDTSRAACGRSSPPLSLRPPFSLRSAPPRGSSLQQHFEDPSGLK